MLRAIPDYMRTELPGIDSLLAYGDGEDDWDSGIVCEWLPAVRSAIDVFVSDVALEGNAADLH